MSCIRLMFLSESFLGALTYTTNWQYDKDPGTGMCSHALLNSFKLGPMVPPSPCSI